MRFALAIEYNGKPYCGWQRQKHSVSVQEKLEHALSQVADQPIVLHCSGRTDTGVHALAQIAHFDSTAERPLRAWTFGVNTHLPKSIAVHWVSVMPDHFHARFKAVSRSYRYTILNRLNRSGYQNEYMHWVAKPLNDAIMHEAAQCLLGVHDFSAFRSADCQAPHAQRNIIDIAVTRERDRVYIDITGNAFLHNMVRIITGSLIKIGLQEQPAEWLKEILHSGDRTCAGMTAPAAGLCFMQATYPQEFAIPNFS